MTGHHITDEAQLDEIYGEPRPASLLKEIDHISEEYRAFIEAAPFMALATSGPGGLDCSPRGDDIGVVDVVDPRTIRFPDWKGNNRLDSLRNLVHDPRIALLFLVPGVTEAMRVNGTAVISTEPELLAHYSVDGRSPRTVVEVAVQRVYFQCSRALLRSGLWDPARHLYRSELPSCGEMLERISGGHLEARAYDADLAERLHGDLY
jgi:PPOX class probable FMN-dependent enzyme